MLKNGYFEDSEEYEKLTKEYDIGLNLHVEKNKKNKKEDWYNKVLRKFSISDQEKIRMISMYNSFLSQLTPVDKISRAYLNQSYFKTRDIDDSTNKNYFTGLNDFSENINYTTFKIALEKIVKNNSNLEDFEIYNSRTFIDQTEGVDFQVILRRKKGKPIIFGIDQKNFNKENYFERDGKFIPLAFNDDGNVRESSEISSNIKYVNTSKPTSKNSYILNIDKYLQQKINKKVFKNNLEISLEDLEQIEGFNEIYYFLENIVNTEVGISNGTINPEDIVEESAVTVKDRLFGYSLEDLERLKVEKEKNAEKAKKLEKEVVQIEENKQKISKQKNRVYTKPKMRITSLPNNLKDFVYGEQEFSQFIYKIGNDENSYKIYEFIVEKCKVLNPTGNQYNGNYLMIESRFTIEIFQIELNEKQRFEEIKNYSNIKLKQKEILKLINERKRTLLVKEKEEILLSYKNNFTNFHFSDKDYKNFNEKFSYKELSLLGKEKIGNILTYLSFLIEIDSNISITRDEILDLRNGQKLGRSEKIEKDKIKEILNKTKKTINDKFLLLEYYSNKKVITGVDKKNIIDIYKTTFKQYKQTFLNKEEISDENKVRMFELFKKAIKKLDEKIISDKVIKKIDNELIEMIGKEEYDKILSENLEEKESKIQKQIILFKNFLEKENLDESDIEEINNIIGKYFPTNATNFRNRTNYRIEEKKEFIELAIEIEEKFEGIINPLVKKLNVVNYLNKQKELLNIKNQEVRNVVVVTSKNTSEIIE